ncbi:glutamate--tRNA ligase [Desulfolithobacter dissulfuricans]|uniref:Glutamate--tRNA ligase n=1 Tax=Desulfolithobacter dissulfuricans TaxID=2795293 RepID=A0A915TZX5_9BACT|nr:glutamate--tRNA ligase [Desulfolithobacter dissulfuricans]BCO08926.1 glutamate--tRNA ligase [Desulfolithobacter dissulfuricans]
MTEVRVRFPPSPTGYLHIGGARTALLNWLYARKTGGKLILRIEDTDAERSTQESIEGILDGLNWLGLDWDEGPYFQTEFADEHVAAANRLLESGHAYKCFCTKEELDAKREAALAAKKDVRYDGTCRNLSPEEVAEKEAAGIPYVVRFKVPQKEGTVAYEDKVLGRIERAYSDIEDFVIVRSNGRPLYLLCNVVDDIRDRITHVIRGQDHMTNTTRQILLYEALGAPIPVFAHMPLTLDLQKRKISKRSHGEIVAVQFYRDKGFIPWALCNFLVLLGWNPGTDQEIFSREELIEAFTLERISKVNSVFNYRKGDPKFFTDPKAISINAHYLRTMDIEELGAMVKKELEEAGLWDEAYDNDKKQWYLETLDLIRDRFHTLKDFCTMGRAYFGDDYEIEAKPLKKNILKHPDLKKWLPMLAERFAQLPEWTKEETERVTRALAGELDIKPGILINGMRTVLTGQLAGPGMFDILIALGQDRVVQRLQNIDHLYEENAS